MPDKIKILIAPNSMKGSLNAFAFSDTIEEAFMDCSENFETRKIPVADGGDLTGEILAKSLNAVSQEVEVRGPLGKKVSAKYAVADKRAIIEMADASGMKLVNTSELNPMLASSFGTGELIRHAVQNACSEIYLAIGGSATVDGGLGMMRALGFVLLDKNDNELEGKGEDLSKLMDIVPLSTLDSVNIRIICDVDNPLLGQWGAAKVFGPQKGATPEMVGKLEKGLQNLSEILFQKTGKDLRDLKGAGAAGGISLPLLAFGNAEIVAGADFVLKQLGFEEAVRRADLVITGEGKLDSQTLNNKAPFAVARIARKYNKPVIAIAGKVEEEASEAFDGIFTLVSGPVSPEQAMQQAKQLTYRASYELAKMINRLTQV